MKRLPPAVRGKAIEIANALLASGHDEGMAIRVAIACARRWARRHPDHLAGTPPPGQDRDPGHQWL
jgi:uncharacterized protein YdaT